MNAGASFRGQPLLMLLALLGGWVALRIVLWMPPFADPAGAAPGHLVAQLLSQGQDGAAEAAPALASATP